MDQKFYLAVLVISIVASHGFCGRFKGVPVLFPSNLPNSLNVQNSAEQESPDQYSSSTGSGSVNPSNIQPENLYKNPSDTQSKSSVIRFVDPYFHSGSTNTRTLYPSVPKYHYNYVSRNNINPVQKTINFAQRETPSCAKTSVLDGLCEEDTEYDSEIEERFSKALQKINVSEGFYESILSKVMVENSVSFTSRIGNDRILEDPVCPSSEKFIFPKRGMTRSKTWVFLLNQGNMKQGIKVEECLNTSGLSRLSVNGDLSCGLTTDTGVNSVCRQKFIFKNMITMDKSGNNVVTEAILIPSCCACLRKHSANRINRVGFEFDEFGNLITEQSPTATENNLEARNKEVSQFGNDVNDDEDFSFGLPPM